MSDDVVTSFDIGVYGMRDCEGIGIHPGRGTLLAVDPIVRHASTSCTKTGAAACASSTCRRSRCPSATTANIASVTVAPSSDVDGRSRHVMSLWVVDRQVDNGVDPEENDGLLHEFAIPVE